MDEALRFFRAYETWIYLILGLGGLYFIRKFFIAWRELSGAVFSLERESAQSHLNHASGGLVILLLMALCEFSLVYFIAPQIPGANPISTPTLNLLATSSQTLPALTPLAGATNPVALTATPMQASIGDCIPGQIEITSPLDGQEVSGVIEVLGSADIPNFGFYKFEIKRPDETVWLTIQAGNVVIKGGKLGDWDTSRLTPGEYNLSLVLVDNEARASAPCMVLIRVAATAGATPGP
jgi:hypothetical protein